MEYLITLRIVFATLLIMIAFVGMQYFKERRKQWYLQLNAKSVKNDIQAGLWNIRPVNVVEKY